MRLVASLLVEQVVKHDSGTVDLIGVHEDIYTDQMPVTLPPFAIWLDFEVDPRDYGTTQTAEVQLLNPDLMPASTVFGVSLQVPKNPPHPHVTFDAQLTVERLQIRAYGPHCIQIRVQGKPLRHILLDVKRL